MNDRFFRGIASLAIAALALAACKPEAPPPNPPRAVNVVRVSPATGVGGNSYAGEVRARYESPMGFRVPGKVAQRLVDIGDGVKQGDVLMRLDPADQQLAEEAVRQQVSAAQTNYEQQKSDYARFQALHQQGFIGAADLERRKAALDMAAAQWKQAQAQWNVNRNQAGYTALRAEHAGVVTAISAEAGQVVDAGTPVVRIARLEEKDLAISIPENRVGEMARGKEARITLWATPDKTYRGRIREISPAADPVTRTYTVKVAFLDADTAVNLGMTASAFLGPGSDGKAIRIPPSALYQQGDKAAVWVVDNRTSQVTLRPVKVERYADDYVAVAAGLEPGDTIVRAGVHKLFPGEKVRVLAEGTP